MSDDFVQQEPDGQWAAVCLRGICFDMDRPFTIGSYATKTAADRARRAHARSDAVEQDRIDARLAGCCPTCWRPR